ncbi:MAG: single-stranded DNA-binding protein [Mycoplasmatales bacterium]
MVNNVVLIGRITRDLEVKSSTTGVEICNFSIAVNRNFKNSSGEYDADFISCVAFRQTAKFMGQYLQKGNLISVTGRIQTRSYDNDQGQRIYITEVVAENVSGLESRRNNAQSEPSFNNNPAPTPSNNAGPQSFMGNPQYANDVTSTISDDDLPF